MTNKIKAFLGSIVLLPIIVWLIINNGRFIFFIDHFNLLIHEGGHGIFRFFGKFIYTLGGSLMQILIPSLILYYFYSNRKIFGAQASLVFLGENLLNISGYALDAKAQKLPLLGGNRVYHDWHYLLDKLNILDYYYFAGYFFIALAFLSFLISLLLPIIMNKYSTEKINLNL